MAHPIICNSRFYVRLHPRTTPSSLIPQATSFSPSSSLLSHVHEQSFLHLRTPFVPHRPHYRSCAPVDSCRPFLRLLLPHRSSPPPYVSRINFTIGLCRSTNATLPERCCRTHFYTRFVVRCCPDFQRRIPYVV